MAFSYVGGATDAGTGTTASVTHGLTISAGDLVVFYVNSNSNSTNPSPNSGGAAWETETVDAPSGESARQAIVWKIAGSSEPSSYSWSVGNAQWRCIVKVFSSASDAVIDSAVNSTVDTADATVMHCEAINGQTISANAVSCIFGGKDNRQGTDDPYTSADNSYVSALGNSATQQAAGAHRIFGATGTSSITAVDISGNGQSDKTYSFHVSFVEGSSTTDDLLANDVESASEVSTPALGQTHALLANDVESASEVSTPALGQVHALLANDVESASEVSTPTVSESHILLANDVESASEVSTPALGQTHALLANDVESASEVSTPTLAEVGAGVDNLLANDVESASEVSIPALGQVHVLLADDIESASEVSLPTLDRPSPSASSGRGFVEAFM